MRDFVLLSVDHGLGEIGGDGRRAKKRKGPWAVTGEMSGNLFNLVTSSTGDPGKLQPTLPEQQPSVRRGNSGASGAGDSSLDARVFFDCNSSFASVPLYAIDNAEMQDFVDSWIHAYTVALEHADYVRKEQQRLARAVPAGAVGASMAMASSTTTKGAGVSRRVAPDSLGTGSTGRPSVFTSPRR